MGKIKYINDIRSFFKKNIVVDINSLKKFIQSRKGNEEYIHQLVRDMLKKGEIKRITKGYYTIYDDPVLSVFCFKPSYLGLQSALGIHNLWEQETIPIILTVKKIRQGIRKVNENNIMIHRILPKYFFGFEYVKDGDFYIPVSDLEKTFIDLIYFKQKIDKDLLKNFQKKLNRTKLNNYLNRYPKNTRFKIKNLLG